MKTVASARKSAYSLQMPEKSDPKLEVDLFRTDLPERPERDPQPIEQEPPAFIFGCVFHKIVPYE